MKKQLFLLAMFLLPIMANAYDFELDGFYYNVISVSDLTLELTTDVEIKDKYNDTDNNKKYSGDITIPKSINYKGKEWTIERINGTFKFSTEMTSVSIPSSIIEIGECSFVGCYSLKEIVLSEGIQTIGKDAFFFSGLEKIIIPKNVSYVGRCAFCNCNSLKEVIIEEGDNPIYFEGGNWLYGVFADCPQLNKAVINRNYTFSDGNGGTPPFRHCTSLKELSLGGKMASIPKLSFEGCTSLLSVEISEKIHTIGECAFEDCTNLEIVNMPLSITTISNKAFKNCKSLKSAQIHKGMTTIGTSAFEGCASITSLDIVKTISSIEANAFNGCTSLKDIYVHNTIPISSVEESSFSGSSYLDAILYVPTGHIETYNNAPVWKLFFNIQEKRYGYSFIYIVDGEEYKKYDIEEGESITPEAEPIKEGYTFSGWSEIPETMPAHDVTVTGTFSINKYKLTYTVDGEEYKSYEVEYGASITPEPTPTKEGYTFSGWSEIPATMPAHDVTVTGTFTINKYKLTYIVDGEEYKTYEVEYGATITPEAEPTKEGYTFSGWSEIPATMPAHDVTVTGTFSINKYKLTYVVDGAEYKTYEIKYGAAITPEAEPTKEGYTFSGWSEIPETMPAHDVTITGTFTKGEYKLTYYVDGVVYKTVSYDYGATITPETEPTKEGYTFSGWSEIPETMPAYDVTVTGTLTINKYKLTYIVDGAEYKTYEIEYNATITAEAVPTKEGYTFSGWSEIPSTMPPYDVTVTGSFNINSYKLTYMIDDKVYKETMYEYGATIIAEPQPEGDYQTFEWTDLPQTMPAHDVVVHASYTSGIIDVLMTSRQNVRIYSANGKKLNKLQKGINIVILNDGTVKKVVVK